MKNKIIITTKYLSIVATILILSSWFVYSDTALNSSINQEWPARPFGYIIFAMFITSLILTFLSKITIYPILQNISFFKRKLSQFKKNSFYYLWIFNLLIISVFILFI